MRQDEMELTRNIVTTVTSVNTTSVMVVDANPLRRAITIRNNGGADVFIGLDSAAVAVSSPIIIPGNSMYSLHFADLVWSGQVYAIRPGILGAANIIVMEWLY